MNTSQNVVTVLLLVAAAVALLIACGLVVHP